MFVILLLIFGHHVFQSSSKAAVESLSEADQKKEEDGDTKVLVQNSDSKSGYLISVRRRPLDDFEKRLHLKSPKLHPTGVKVDLEKKGSYSANVRSHFVVGKDNSSMLVSITDDKPAYTSDDGTVHVAADEHGEHQTTPNSQEWVNSVKGDIKVDFRQHQSDGHGSYLLNMQAQTKVTGDHTSEPNRTLPAIHVQGNNRHVSLSDYNHVAVSQNNRAKSENSDSYHVNVAGGRRSSNNLLVDMTGDIKATNGQKYHMDAQIKSLGNEPLESSLGCWTSGVDGSNVKLNVRLRRIWHPLDQPMQPRMHTYEATLRLKSKQVEADELVTATCFTKANDGRVFQVVLSLRRKDEYRRKLPVLSKKEEGTTEVKPK